MDATGPITPEARRLWQEEVRRLYAQMMTHREPYSVLAAGLEIMVLPNVFSPKYITNSAWFADEVTHLVGKKRLLEIGTGTGLVALAAALGGAVVSATDLNPCAVQNARLNFHTYGVKETVYEGDVFDPVHPDERFDYIFWNHPFNRGDNPKEIMLLRAGFDYEYQSLTRYIAEARRYLTPGGRLLLGTGNFADLSKVHSIAASHGYRPFLLASKEFPVGPCSSLRNVYHIYELQSPPS